MDDCTTLEFPSSLAGPQNDEGTHRYNFKWSGRLIRCREFAEGTMLYECSTHVSILFPFIPKLRNELMFAQLGVVFISGICGECVSNHFVFGQIFSNQVLGHSSEIF